MRVDTFMLQDGIERIQIDIEHHKKEITDSVVMELVRERKRLGLTQQDIADISGMKAPNVTRIESRKYSPSLEVLMRYANAVGKQVRLEVTDLGYEEYAEVNRVAEAQSYRTASKLPLPIGVSEYKKASSDYYYVDKTLLIRDVLDERSQVMLFTRPRRFGKTLNMDMLRVFFEKTQEDTSVYFKNKKIWQCGERYREYQGKYPVISVTFKDVKFHTWEDTFAILRRVFSDEAYRHEELRESEKCSELDKRYFEKLLSQKISSVELTSVFLILSRMLHAHYGIAPIIIIDEYDIPIQQGYVSGFYEDAVTFIRNLFSAGFKDNAHLTFGFMTGILRVAQESIFSGLNNIRVNSVLDDSFSEYFGFTPEEVQQLCHQYGVIDKYEEICKWYDGYRFGESEIFNPWSVINYFANKCKAKPYWVSTSSNDIIGELIEQATPEICERLEELLNEKPFVVPISTDVIYPQIKQDPASVFSFLLMTGYLKILENDFPPELEGLHRIALPNKEILSVYKKEIISKMLGQVPFATTIDVQQSLLNMEIDALQSHLQRFLYQTVSYHDTAEESFYHGLVLGLCAIMDTSYTVTSNRESGAGRYDIQLMPKKAQLPGILIELKSKKDVSQEELKGISQEALKQINDKKYDTQLLEQGIEIIYKYGVAFSGKNVEIITETVRKSM